MQVKVIKERADEMPKIQISTECPTLFYRNCSIDIKGNLCKLLGDIGVFITITLPNNEKITVTGFREVDQTIDNLEASVFWKESLEQQES